MAATEKTADTAKEIVASSNYFLRVRSIVDGMLFETDYGPFKERPYITTISDKNEVFFKAENTEGELWIPSYHVLTLSIGLTDDDS